MENKSDKFIAVIGGTNFDIHAKVCDPILLRDSNPGRITTSSGGVGRNIAENLARLGNRCVLLSTVGDDALGRGIIKDCADAGIDVGRLLVSKDYGTSCYIDIDDPSGDMYLAANDMANIENLPLSYLAENAGIISSAAAVVCDANLIVPQLEALIDFAGSVPVFADPVSAAKAVRLLPILGRLQLLKPNLLELETLSGTICKSDTDIENAAAGLLETGLKSIVVSLGSRGCYYADREGRRIFMPAVKAGEIVNTTGAGDAFMAGLTTAYIREMPLETGLNYALGCAALTIRSAASISPYLTHESVLEFIK